jgi:large subunit ribosomal protein L10
MARSKAEKDVLVGEIEQVLGSANTVYLVSLAGLPSNDVNKLRASLRKEGARVRVVKNRLAKRATAGRATEQISEHFRGPTAIVYHPSDPVATAKGLIAFAKDNPKLVLKAGLIEQKQAIDAAGFKLVSELPSLPEVRSMLLGVIQAPASTLVRLLNTPGTQLARVIAEREKQLA